MKKYVKPDVAFEGFELSQYIAGSCMGIMNHSDVYQCSLVESGDLGQGTEGLFCAQGICKQPVDSMEGFCLYNQSGFGLMNS